MHPWDSAKWPGDLQDDLAFVGEPSQTTFSLLKQKTQTLSWEARQYRLGTGRRVIQQGCLCWLFNKRLAANTHRRSQNVSIVTLVLGVIKAIYIYINNYIYKISLELRAFMAPSDSHHDTPKTMALVPKDLPLPLGQEIKPQLQWQIRGEAQKSEAQCSYRFLGFELWAFWAPEISVRQTIRWKFEGFKVRSFVIADSKARTRNFIICLVLVCIAQDVASTVGWLARHTFSHKRIEKWVRSVSQSL